MTQNQESQFIMSINITIREILFFRHAAKLILLIPLTSLAEKVHALEYLHYPKVIEDLVVKLPDFLIKGPEEA